MRRLSWLVTLSWHEVPGVHTRTERGQYEAEAWEEASSIRDGILEEARLSLGVPHRTEYAVLVFWVQPEAQPSE